MGTDGNNDKSLVTDGHNSNTAQFGFLWYETFLDTSLVPDSCEQVRVSPSNTLNDGHEGLGFSITGQFRQLGVYGDNA
jgi:hypothetical protein